MATQHSDILDWMRLAAVTDVGPVAFRTLVDHFGSPREVLNATRAEIGAVPGLRGASGIAESLDTRAGVDDKKFSEELARAADLGVTLIGYGMESYPRLLREIHDPPPVLYIRGALVPDDECAVAIVGSRAPDQFGQKITEELADGLARRGVTIVSGLARGIDSIGHRAALAAGGRTLAVLGSGVDTIYPEEHEALAAEIVQHGAVVSFYPLGTEPDAKHFPPRNRVISGLSLGVVVAQAAHAKSGALITARNALDQNRLVFAVPGAAGKAVARETNRLIREGAILVEEAEHIVEAIAPLLGTLPRDTRATAREQRATSHQPSLLEASTPTIRAPRVKPLAPKLSGEQATLYERLTDEPMTVDALAIAAAMPVSAALATLLQLELSGVIKQLPGHRYVRTS